MFILYYINIICINILKIFKIKLTDCINIILLKLILVIFFFLSCDTNYFRIESKIINLFNLFHNLIFSTLINIQD